MSDLVRIDSAADAVGISVSKLYKLVEAKLVPSYRAGRALRFDVDELRQALRKPAVDLAKEVKR